MMDGYDMNGWGWFGMLMMVIITAAIVGLVVWSIAARGPGSPSQRELSACEQLDARLARGEIDTQEYRARLEALSGHRPGT
jgi:putative membrane protein